MWFKGHHPANIAQNPYEHQKFATKNTCLKKDILSPVVL